MKSKRRLLSLLLIAAIFIVSGVLHFAGPSQGFYVRIVRPWLSNPLLLVQLSGVAELLGGVGILVPGVRRAAGLGLIALLVAVFPANIHMALHPDQFADIAGPVTLVLRLPLQLALAYWIWRATKRRER